MSKKPRGCFTLGFHDVSRVSLELPALPIVFVSGWRKLGFTEILPVALGELFFRRLRRVDLRLGFGRVAG